MRRRIKIMENVTINQKTASILESSSVGPATISDHEAHQIEWANTTGLQPVVFVHGLWLLPSSWDRWASVFEEAGYTTLSPSWPDDPETVDEAKANPEVFANKTVGQVADHFDGIIRRLTKKPAIIGHSFGGLLVQILAGRGLSAATVAIDPAPFRGVLPLPLSALKSASASPMPSARRRPRNSTRRSPYRHRARHCSKPPLPISTPGRRRKSISKI